MTKHCDLFVGEGSLDSIMVPTQFLILIIVPLLFLFLFLLCCTGRIGQIGARQSEQWDALPRKVCPMEIS